MADCKDTVNVKVDGLPVEVPAGTLIIRAAEELGIHIPRFCDHPLLAPVGACRQCLVDVAMPDREGNVRKMPKPQAACTMTVCQGMEVSTQLTSAEAARAQEGVTELLLINHPLDCPICDKAGECPLQNQAFSHGNGATRFTGTKRTYPKPMKLTSEILLDRERCILCQRCTRFSKEIAGDAFIDLHMRGAKGQIGAFDAQVLGFADPDSNPDGTTFTPVPGLSGPDGCPGLVGGGVNSGPVGPEATDNSGRPFASYFSGNTVQICPVGALTSSGYRFRARPFDLVSTPAITEHDASGAAVRIDFRRGKVLRRLAGEDPAVNEEWISDKDRFAFTWQNGTDRIAYPLVRDEEGNLVPTSWADAMDVAATGLRQAQANGGVGFLPGGRLIFEDALAWSKFARRVAGTNDIDQRNRAHSAEEALFLAANVAGTGLGVTYAELEQAQQVLLVALEPEDECATLFLRLRKANRKGTAIATVAPIISRGSRKMGAQVILAVPGQENTHVQALMQAQPPAELAGLAAALRSENAYILVGERAAATPGLLTAVAKLAAETGARLAWIPRRAGERGGVEAGLLPNLLPGGRPATSAEARADLEVCWGAPLPDVPGRDTAQMLAALGAGELGGIVVGGIDLRDLPAELEAKAALSRAGFMVQLEVLRSNITARADVVFPVAPPAEKPGTFVNWEGRVRPFAQVLTSRALSDRQVLCMLAKEMGVDLGLADLKDLHAEYNDIGLWSGLRVASFTATATAAAAATPPAELVENQVLLATHKPLLDAGRCQEGEPYLAGTARLAIAQVSAGTAERVGLHQTGVLVTGPAGTVTLPLVIADMPDDVVWLPQCSQGSLVYSALGAAHGSVVTLSATEVK